jgi:hypothetical protein
MTRLTAAASTPWELAPYLWDGDNGRGPRQAILGIAADAERVYVFRWSRSQTFPRPGAGRAAGGRGEYLLQVFWLADGSAVGQYELTGAGLPQSPPPGSFGRGPLSVEGGAASAYGQTVRFRGRERAK